MNIRTKLWSQSFIYLFVDPIISNNVYYYTLDAYQDEREREKEGGEERKRGREGKRMAERGGGEEKRGEEREINNFLFCL